MEDILNYYSILDFGFRLRPCCRSGILDCPLFERRGLQILDKRFWINDFMIE